jgi:hypothetical protein
MREASIQLLPETAAGTDAATSPANAVRHLTETDAVEIWIARWLRMRPKHLVARYACDSRRLYEIWWGDKFPGSRAKAERLFRERYPGFVERTGFGYKRIPVVAPDIQRQQLSLFE